MKEKLLRALDKTIIYSFYLLFFLVPLFLTPYNYELFEYNKMMLVYGLTTIITVASLGKMILSKEVKINRTPLDIPLLLFLTSQIVSTIFSIDRHVSLWGYYSRFNGGLVSTISYILLYYAFVTHFPKEKIMKLLKIALISGVLVSLYGILEHFGIDRDLWVQDVQNRVFSTLGQPNWLAAYLAVLIPLTIGTVLSKFTIPDTAKDIKKILHASGIGFIISIIFYTTLLFTKSRSGFLGFWITNIIFWTILLSKYQKNLLKILLIFNFSFLIFTFLFGAPFAEINRFTLPELLRFNQQPTTGNVPPTKPLGSSIIEIGITESATIRRIVWKGALDIFKGYPLFGSGVETFAFSYYKFRPVEHNLTSEWDFLYNKAHNEYLNYAATTGIFGLGSYLLIIGVFIWWNIKNIKSQLSIIILALFSGWLSILITNFFGFSVVLIQLFFFLIPAISFVLSDSMKNVMLNSFQHLSKIPKQVRDDNVSLNNQQRFALLILFFVLCYVLFGLTRTWYADTLFAEGYRASRNGEYTGAYQKLREALLINSNEPLYYDEFALPAAQLATAFAETDDSTTSAQLTKEAILASTQAVTSSPNNVNFWKNRTRVFYALSQIDETYLTAGREALEKAQLLSPTDPKISYNLAILLDREGKREEAIAILEETTKLKPDYRDAFFALALFYEQNKEREKAKEMFNYILTRISPNDEDVKKQLEGLQ